VWVMERFLLNLKIKVDSQLSILWNISLRQNSTTLQRRVNQTKTSIWMANNLEKKNKGL
jgi:hypothetical protein